QRVATGLLEHGGQEGARVPPSRHHHRMTPGPPEAASYRIAERDPGLLDGVPAVTRFATVAGPERARFPHRQSTAARLVAQDLAREEAADLLEMRPAGERRIALEDLEDADQVERRPRDPGQRAQAAAEQESAVDHDGVQGERAGPLRGQVPRSRACPHDRDVALARRLELERVGADPVGWQ